jgi:uncharacterized protein
VTRLPPAFAAGLRHFNAGRYFAAHEAFEELLDEVEDERWDLLVALIQVAVGYHKAAEGHPGAARMLGLGAAKLARFPAVLAGVDVADLRARVAEDLAAVESGGSLAGRLAAAPPRLRMRAG